MRLVNSFLKKQYTKDGFRRVPTNVRSLTGEVDGQQFESSLERDLLLLTHWNYEVDWHQSQPVEIEYESDKGEPRIYTPDLLIQYRDMGKEAATRKPVLCEVKYREDLAKDWIILKPKFKAAIHYAKEREWRFKIYTEKEIRTPYLENVQFLWSYRFATFHEHHYKKLKSLLLEHEEITPRSLLEKAYDTKVSQGEALWTLWCMVARRWVKCDLTMSLSMKSILWMDE